MTAEIAILNKSAVALAADSALTISVGTKQEKIFDSADKLFELSDSNSIGVMLYNGMSFMEAPIPSLVRSYRDQGRSFKTVESAAMDFLRFLHDFGKRSPAVVKERHFNSLSRGVVSAISSRFEQNIRHELQSGTSNISNAVEFKKLESRVLGDTISLFERALKKTSEAAFIGGSPVFRDGFSKSILTTVKSHFTGIKKPHSDRILTIVKSYLRGDALSPSRTGIVVAGFGSTEKFPSLVSYELDGMVCDRLKYVRTNYVDIDRQGERAKIIPFAQKEMVDRFLYGLDDTIQVNISAFCQNTIPELRKLAVANAAPKNKATLEKEFAAAEDAFVLGLKEKAFEKIRKQSKSEIEDMVEFMPKPELATMAEALVNLTSIKRRVSRGMETVGGPIDVAVISQSEGFVWVKRKHYFPAELNQRYFARVKAKLGKK
jgi:hypothetical protein